MQIQDRSGGFICLSCTHETEAWNSKDLYHLTECMNYNQFTRKQQYNLQLAKIARQLSRLTPPGLKQLKAAVCSWAYTEGHWCLIFKVYSPGNISVAFKSSCCVIYSHTCSCVKVIIAQRLIQMVQVILTAMQNKKAMKSESSSLQEWQKDVQYAK